MNVLERARLAGIDTGRYEEAFRNPDYRVGRDAEKALEMELYERTLTLRNEQARAISNDLADDFRRYIEQDFPKLYGTELTNPNAHQPNFQRQAFWGYVRDNPELLAKAQEKGNYYSDDLRGVPNTGLYEKYRNSNVTTGAISPPPTLTYTARGEPIPPKGEVEAPKVEHKQAEIDAFIDTEMAKYKGEGGYDLAAYLRDHPGQEDMLKYAGFKTPDVEAATKLSKPKETAKAAQLSPQQEAQLKYPGPEYEPPPFPNNLTTRQLVSIISLAVAEPSGEKVSLKDIFEKLIKAEKAKIAIGTRATGAIAEEVSQKAKENLVKFTETWPEAVKEPALFAGGIVAGAIEAPYYMASFGGQLAQVAWAPDKIGNLKDIAIGMGTFFASIPAKVAASPAYAGGEIIGMFFVGPEGLMKFGKSAAARLSPAYIPGRGMGIEYSVVRIPTEKIGKVEAISATNKAITQALRSETGEAIVKIGDGEIHLRIKPTPVSETVGPALYHATPDISPGLYKGEIKGELFTSPQAAPRFLESSAGGVPINKPAILMIYTKDKGMIWQPSTNLYKGTKELEAIFKDTKIERVPNLYSRILGGKAGEFITIHDGYIIPIYRFKEAGAIVPKFGPAELAAIRVKAAAAGLSDLVKGKKGYELGRVDINQMAKRIDEMAQRSLTGRTGIPTKELVESVGERQYSNAIDEAARSKIESLYRVNPDGFANEYRTNPDRFERAYLRELNHAFVSTRIDESLATSSRVYTSIPIISRLRPSITEERPVNPERELATTRQPEVRTPSGEIITSRPRIPPIYKPLQRTPPQTTSPTPERPRPVASLRIKPKQKSLTAADLKGAVGWEMGELKRGDKKVSVVKVMRPPFYKIETYVGEIPAGFHPAPDSSSAIKTVQRITGNKLPPTITGRIGFETVTVKQPGVKPGEPGTIHFKPETSKVRIVRQATSSPVILKPINYYASSRGQGMSTTGASSVLRSRKVGKIYHTPVPGGTLLSRRSLRRKR